MAVAQLLEELEPDALQATAEAEYAVPPSKPVEVRVVTGPPPEVCATDEAHVEPEYRFRVSLRSPGVVLWDQVHWIEEELRAVPVTAPTGRG
ncbi:MAG: hypothetical protein L3J96_07970, partial [Thermoplasmata archaeon]|nr:hypothetical protein [Thermoplasmata archaeon]